MLKCLRRILEMRGSAGLYVITNGTTSLEALGLVWSKNKGVGAGPLRAPPLDPQLVLVTKLPPPRSNTKILDIALARGLRTKIKKKTVLNHTTYRSSLR